MRETMAQDIDGDIMSGAIALEEQIIAKTSSGTQKLPMLDVIFAGVSSSLISSLKAGMGLLAEVEFGEVSYMSWGKAISSLDTYELCIVSGSDPWDKSLIVAIDPALFYTVYEIELNGKEIPETYPKRQPSNAEKRVAKRFAQIFLNEVSTNFNRVSSVRFIAENVETTQQASSMQSAQSSCVMVEIILKIEHMEGRIRTIFPTSSLEPVQKQLAKMFLGDNFEGDENWRVLLKRRVDESHVDIEAVLRTKDAPVSEILSWAPGMILDLGPGDEQDVVVTCSGVPILRGTTGHRKNKRAIQVTDEYGSSETLIDGMMEAGAFIHEDQD